jgi:hypothetical protein
MFYIFALTVRIEPEHSVGPYHSMKVVASTFSDIFFSKLYLRIGWIIDPVVIFDIECRTVEW